MRSLDETIEKLGSIYYNTFRKAIPDALHYLKEYQAILPLVPSLINTALEVQKKGKTIG